MPFGPKEKKKKENKTEGPLFLVACPLKGGKAKRGIFFFLKRRRGLDIDFNTDRKGEGRCLAGRRKKKHRRRRSQERREKGPSTNHQKKKKQEREAEGYP